MKSNTTNAQNVAINGRNKYLDILNEGWALHLTPRLPDAPTVISTFAGGGGSSLGYSMAGFRELLAVEWDDNAVETLKLNFPDVPVYHGDIAKLSVDQVFEITGLKEGELDVFDGSPPCQGFSTAGKRILEDPRNGLFREYVRLLRGLKPKVFVMENVSGMVKGKMKLIFAEIMRELKASGYQVSARLMNAMYFNVPQSRQRMIFIGVRDDLGIIPSHPQPITCGLNVECTYFNDGQVLTGIELERWQRIPPGGNWQNLPTNLINGKAKFSNFHRKLHGKRPSFTVGKEEHFSSGRFYHWEEPRRINDIELQRIGSFPDNFQFIGHSRDLHMRIGNSVPPMFMKAIAEHIRSHILDKVANG
jgi:DNA (cytosine-5)-methyltransferase 1